MIEPQKMTEEEKKKLLESIAPLLEIDQIEKIEITIKPKTK